MAAPIQFLQLSTEFSEPFIIPNVSPLSPQMGAKSPSLTVSDNTLARLRAMSIIELN